MARRGAWLMSNREGWDPSSYEGYFATRLGSTLRAREEKAVYEFLGAALRSHHSVLEIGSGTGNYTVPVARRCARVVAADASPEMLGYLGERLDREALAGVELRPERLPELSVAAGSFDGVLAVGILNYVEDLEGSLRAMASAIKPGGWAVFNVPPVTAEGRIYALTELCNRRRIYLRSPDEVAAAATGAGLRVEGTKPAGLTRGGITLFVGASRPPQEAGAVQSR